MAETEAATLVKVRCSAHHGNGCADRYSEVADHLVASVLDDLDIYKYPPRLLLLLATSSWCDPGNPLSKHIRDRFHEAISYFPAQKSLLPESAPADRRPETAKGPLGVVPRGPFAILK